MSELLGRKLLRPLAQGCPSDLTLERYLLGELGQGDSGQTSGHLRGCTNCAARLDELRGPVPSAAEELVMGIISREVDSAAPIPAGPAWWQLALSPVGLRAAATAMAVLMLVLPRLMREQERALLPVPGTSKAERPQVTFKGPEATLAVFALRDGVPVRLQSPARVHGSLRLQFAVSSSEPAFVAIYGLENGQASRYVPFDNAMPVRIQPGREVPLEPAFSLDGSPGTETVIAVLCPEPFDTVARMGTIVATTGRPLRSDRGCSTLEFTLEKQGR